MAKKLYKQLKLLISLSIPVFSVSYSIKLLPLMLFNFFIQCNYSANAHIFLFPLIVSFKFHGDDLIVFHSKWATFHYCTIIPQSKILIFLRKKALVNRTCFQINIFKSHLIQITISLINLSQRGVYFFQYEINL